MNFILIQLITLYQKFISPHKGFCCAHAYLHQGDSCSMAVKNIVADQGFITGYSDIRQRFKDCRLAYEDILEKQREKDRRKKEKKESNNDTACELASCAPDVCEMGSAVKRCKVPEMPDVPCTGGCDSLPCDVMPCDCSL